jgi:hypothetical protein
VHDFLFLHTIMWNVSYMCITFLIIRLFSKNFIQKCMSNRPQTLTCGSSQATHACYIFFHVEMKCLEEALTTSSSLKIVAFVFSISSMPCEVKSISFSSASTTACWNLPCIEANYQIKLTTSSYRGSSLH